MSWIDDEADKRDQQEQQRALARSLEEQADRQRLDAFLSLLKPLRAYIEQQCDQINKRLNLNILVKYDLDPHNRPNPRCFICAELNQTTSDGWVGYRAAEVRDNNMTGQPDTWYVFGTRDACQFWHHVILRGALNIADVDALFQWVVTGREPQTLSGSTQPKSEPRPQRRRWWS